MTINKKKTEQCLPRLDGRRHNHGAAAAVLKSSINGISKLVFDFPRSTIFLRQVFVFFFPLKGDEQTGRNGGLQCQRHHHGSV